MARDAVAITALASGAATATPVGTTITPANGANIAAVGDTNRLVVRVTNTAGAEHTVTFKAGTSNPPAVRKGLGDLAIPVAASGDVMVILESARFEKPDGSIDVDYETGFTGKISAVRVPKGA